MSEKDFFSNTIIYHNQDLDGFCSGAIVKKFLLEQGETEIKMVGWNYDDADPLPEGNVYLVDISLPDNQMIGLRSQKVIWIDHHKSAIEASVGKWDWFDGVRKVGDSATLLAWRYFFPDRIIPEIVYWVDRYDVWKKDVGDGKDWIQVMQMQYGMKSNLFDPAQQWHYDDWDMNFESNDSMQSYCKDGKRIYLYVQQQNEQYSKRAFDLEFERLIFCAINQGEVNSEVVNSVVREDHDGILMFYHTGKSWKVSLRGNVLKKDGQDLSLIAIAYGGGGHRNSCSFTIEEINDVLMWNEFNPLRKK